MTERAKLEFGVLASAVLLGFAGDGLLRALPWGANFALWMGGLLLALATLAAWRREALAGAGVPLLELEVDCVDARNQGEGQQRTRLQAFAETLG